MDRAQNTADSSTRLCDGGAPEQHWQNVNIRVSVSMAGNRHNLVILKRIFSASNGVESGVLEPTDEDVLFFVPSTISI